MSDPYFIFSGWTVEEILDWIFERYREQVL